MKYVNGTSGNPYIDADVHEICRIAGMRIFPEASADGKSIFAGINPHIRTGIPMTLPFDDAGTDYRITTTAEGILEEKNTVYEIIDGFTETNATPARVHSGTLLMNSFIYGTLHGCTSVTACTILIRQDEIKEIRKTYAIEELCARFGYAMLCVRRRGENEKRRVLEMLPSVDALPFPHSSFRPGQRELVETVWKTVKDGGRLFVQAPTGIGKTVSVLYGALRAMKKADIRRIFYLTAKQSTRREAFAAAASLAAAGACARTVIITAKEQISPYRGQCYAFVCDAGKCPLMKDYEKKSGQALDSLLSEYNGFPAGTIRKTAAEYGICPYEFSLDLSEFCDIIICDYNYIFDPAVRLRRYFGENESQSVRNVFLIDEAHNLPERARDMFSAELTPEDADALGGFAADNSDIINCGTELKKALQDCRSLCSDNTVKDENGLESGWYFAREQITSVDSAVNSLLDVTEKFYFSHRNDLQAASAAASLANRLRKWQSAAEAYDGRYRTYISIDRGKISAKLYCLDPSARLGAGIALGHASVFFSATLTPSDYFADILGGGQSPVTLSLPSPFPRENLFVCSVPAIDTRFEAREKSYKKIVYVIASAALAKPGNYIVFFPSYAYMTPVYEAFVKKYPKVSTVCQNRGMTAADREKFLSFFRDDENNLRIGFCVLGGSFSEGVDLPGGRLIGTVIVGVGLPGLSAERNMIKEYYDSCAERGYDYAYTYPGMNSVLQAAGRVIRREEDKGVVILCDDRYSTPAYRALMPEHWSGFRVTDDLHALQSELRAFWDGTPPPPSPLPPSENQVTDGC